MNKKIIGLFFIFLSTGAFGDSDSVDIKCKIFGPSTEDGKYKTVVSANFQVSVRDIVAPNQAKLEELINQHTEKYLKDLSKTEQEERLNKVCRPVGLLSPLFGNKGGTQLQITAWRCHNREYMYFYQRVVMNGNNFYSFFDKQTGGTRLLFNIDMLTNPDFVSAPSKEDLILEQEPIVIPEGQFYYLYSDCDVEVKE